MTVNQAKEIARQRGWFVHRARSAWKVDHLGKRLANGPTLVDAIRNALGNAAEIEHDHAAHGCKYIGFDLWDCGKNDSSDY